MIDKKIPEKEKTGEILLQKIIDVLEMHHPYYKCKVRNDRVAQEIYALKYQIAGEVWDSYTGYETLFRDWLDQQENND